VFSEFTDQVGRDAEIDLVGCSVIKGTKKHYRVVLPDVKDDKPFDRGG
jgi:hypothetical protein